MPTDDDVMFVGRTSSTKTIIDLSTSAPASPRNKRNDINVVNCKRTHPKAADARQQKKQRTQSNQTKKITCAICLEQPFKNRPSATVCGHVFCNSCIKAAIERHNKCPMCNKKLSLKQVQPLYV